MTDCCGSAHQTLTPLDDALERAREGVTPLTDTETVPLTEAYGRILAEDLDAKLDVPGYDNSAMDGYAVRVADCDGPTTLRVAGKSLAGHPYDGTVGAGEAVVITTGAAVPAGADAVVMVEDTTAEGDHITFDCAVRPGQHIRPAGGDIKQGQKVLPAGRRLRPQDVALAAGQGQGTLTVVRRPRVAVYSSGDEVFEPGQAMQGPGLYDTNRYALIGLLRGIGVEVTDLGILPDDPEALASRLADAASRNDALITSGGVSVGVADFLKQTVESLGQLEMWRLAIKPGKPVAYGRIGDCLVFGLPGNPVSAIVTFLHFARPLLIQLAGGRPEPLPVMRVPVTSALQKRPGRREFMRACLLTTPSGEMKVEPYPNQGSNLLMSLGWANALIDLDEASGPVEAGAVVRVLPLAAVGC